jgi:uncharacterized membrane protein YbhN (UPF0104 family)
VNGAGGAARTQRRGIGAWLRALVGVALLAALLSEIELADALRRVAAAGAGWVALTLLLMLGEGVLGATKWWLLLRVRHPELGLWLVIRISFAASLAATFLPGSVGLELLRGLGVSRSTGDPTASFTSIAVDRAAGFVGLLLVVIAGSLLAPHPALWHVEGLAWLGLVGLLAGLALAARARTRAWIDARLRHPRLAVLLRIWRDASAVLEALLRQPPVIARALLLAVANTLLRVAVVVAAGAAVGISLPLPAWLVAVPVVILAMWLPASVGGFGPREAAFVALLGLHGVPGADALALSILIGILGIAAELPGLFVLLVPQPAPIRSAGAGLGARARD